MGSLVGSVAGYLLSIVEGLLLNRERIDQFQDPVDVGHEPVVVLDQLTQEQEHTNKRRKVEISSDLVACQTQNEHVDIITGWLKDDKVTTIGVCGMGGIGKTTVAQLLYTRLLGGVLYTCTGTRVVDVGWVSVGSHFDLYKVQEKLAEAFGFFIQHEKDLVRRAGLVSAHLSRLCECVILLDDLWTDFCREEVGIPKDCKLVVVSRSWDVCRLLCCQKLIKVESLAEEESWQMFCHTLMSGELESEEILGIAKRVCQECGGVPLAITSVSSSLRGMIDASVWNNVLDCLRRLPLRFAYLEDIFNTLRCSYDRLSQKLKSCLLYCALYPEDYAISEEELICIWVGEMLMGDEEFSQAMYDMGHSVLKKLLSSSLLDNSEGHNRVKMHHLIRDLALSIAGDSVMVKSGSPVSKIPTELNWHENLHVVSLINSVSKVTLESSPKCPNLSTLLLQQNDLHVLPDSFFLHMCGLRVLNLSYTGIESLPSSFSTLEELRVLDVSFCENLRQVPTMAKLQKLQFLDLSHTAIRQVPGSFNMLKSLTELNLSSIQELVKFPKGMLSALSSLKRLSCDIVGTITELLSLKCLEILDARFLNIKDLSNYVRSQHWRTLECFHLQVGSNLGVERTYSKLVSLNGCSLNGRGRNYVVLPNSIQKLYIEDCRDFKSLSDIMNSIDVRSPRNSLGRKTGGGLRQQAEAFTSLETCTISRCHDLEILFPLSWVQTFQHLELIEVEDCRNLKELIAQDMEEHHPVMSLPQLKRVDLTLLPQLHNIYRGRLVSTSLQTLSVLDCPRLIRMPFFFNGLNPAALGRIEGQQWWWEMIQWDQPECKALFKSLFSCSSSTYPGESSKMIYGSR